MSRRRILQALGAGALAAANPGFASTTPGVQRVGVMGRPSGLIQHWKEGFPREFAVHGFVEGRNLELVWFDVLLPEEEALGTSEAVGRRVAARMLGASLDCMVTHADPGTRFLQEVTRSIPIVTDVPDPVGAGFAKSLARPGGNITGLHQGGAEIVLKSIEVLRTLSASSSCVAWIGWSGFPERIRSFEAAAHALGIRAHLGSMQEIGIAGLAELRREFAGLRRNGCTLAVVELADDALWKEAGALALEHRIAMASGSTVNEGTLIHYRIVRSPEHRSVRRIPVIVAKILRGTRPQDLPFEGPTGYSLTLNLKTAARIGITVPPQVMALADQVIR